MARHRPGQGPGPRARRRNEVLSRHWKPSVRLCRLFEDRPPRKLTKEQRRAITRLVEEGGPDSPELRAAVRRVVAGDLDARLPDPHPDFVMFLKTGEMTEQLRSRLRRRVA